MWCYCMHGFILTNKVEGQESCIISEFTLLKINTKYEFRYIAYIWKRLLKYSFIN